MRKKVTEIKDVAYGQYGISSEPSREEIGIAVQKNEVDERGFQDDIDELNAEWNSKATNENEYCDQIRMYHARRIAFFVINGWVHPIVLESNGCEVEDGSHRLKAATYLNMEYVEVTYDPSATSPG